MPEELRLYPEVSRTTLKGFLLECTMIRFLISKDHGCWVENDMGACGY